MPDEPSADYDELWEKEAEKESAAFLFTKDAWDLLYDAIDSSKNTFRNIILMSKIVFVLGISFFIATAISSF